MSFKFNFCRLADRKFMSESGITKEQFHAMTWFTSWAVDADHGSDLCDIIDHAMTWFTSWAVDADHGSDLCDIIDCRLHSQSK
jgi:hypothetical protein